MGTQYEQAAARYLTANGYRIIQKNYRCRRGEIDLIAKEGRYLVFVEVKYRRDGRCGPGQYAVTAAKQRRICFAAAWYLNAHHLPEDVPCRFDVVAVQGTAVTLIRDAFPFARDIRIPTH